MKNRVIAATTAAAGFVFCVVEALGGGIGAICGTTGCEITSGITLLGLSLYWFGAAAFATSLALIASGRLRPAALAALLFLAADIPLLAMLAFSAPCVSCAIVGLLFFLLFLFSWRAYHGPILGSLGENRWTKAAAVVAVLWLAAFSPNLVGSVQEYAAPKPIYGNSDAETKIFFSPTCPDCKDLVEKMVAGGNEDRIALYPVAHSSEDIERMCILDCKLSEGADLDRALDKCWAGKCESGERHFWNKMRLSLISKINMSYLLSMGKTRVPVMVSRTMPKASEQTGGSGVEIGFDSSGRQGSSQSIQSSQGCSFGGGHSREQDDQEQDDCS